jgi:hypothetical protein
MGAGGPGRAGDMSHTCPECGMNCHCCGDIDDCCFDHPEIQIACRHWKECEEDDDDIPDEYDPTEGEPEASAGPQTREGGAA